MSTHHARGIITTEKAVTAREHWIRAAAQVGFKSPPTKVDQPLKIHLAWAKQNGLCIGATYARFSTRFQDSTEDQIRANMECAAREGIYIPPQFIFVDEATSGRKNNRAGLNLLKQTFRDGDAKVLVVFKLSRLFRKQYRGVQFIEEEIVDVGLRALCVSPRIDTTDSKSWRMMVNLIGTFDEAQIEACADHVREAQITRFEAGFIVGNIPVGYRPKEIPEAGKTKRGLPRTKPEIDPDTAPLIVKHFEMIAEGMPLKEAHPRWVKDGGPYDPRSESGYVSYTAYRRMFDNERLIGKWTYGKTKAKYRAKKDFVEHVPTDESEWRTVVNEDLRIIPEELWHRVQARLQGQRTGRSTKRKTDRHLWDLEMVMKTFHCEACGKRLIMGGSRAEDMVCTNLRCASKLHDQKVIGINRKKTVGAVCAKLAELIQSDNEIVGMLCQEVLNLAEGSDSLEQEMRKKEAQICKLESHLGIMLDTIGQIPENAQGTFKSKAAQIGQQISMLKSEVASLADRINVPKKLPTETEICEEIKRITQVLNDAVEGKLGEDVIYKAARVFESLVGGSVSIHFIPRPGRKTHLVKATFSPALLSAVSDQLGNRTCAEFENTQTVEIWLREPPYREKIGPEVARLHEGGIGLVEIARKFGTSRAQIDGAYKRWLELRALEKGDEEAA